MITIQAKKYNLTELNILADGLGNFFLISNCNYECTSCQTKNLCRDINNAHEFIRKMLDETTQKVGQNKI